MTDVTADTGAADVAADATPKTRKPKLPDGCVMVRVLPQGDGKIFTGQMTPNSLTDRFPTYKRGDVFPLHAAVAQAQEDAGRVEIQP
jgi:hypothetical protein